jgi:hypothetical protein
VRAALDWAFSPSGDVATGVALTAVSAPLWFSLALVAEYRARVERALAAIATHGLDLPEMEMRLNISLGAAIFNTRGPVPQIAAASARALEIATRLGDTEYRLRALWGLARERYVQGDYRAALLFCERFDEVVRVAGDPAAGLVRDRMMALALHLVGRQAEARPYGERALDHPAAPTRSTHKSFQEYDSRVASRSHLARILWVQGFPDRAAALAADGVDHALALEYPPPLCYILAYAACPVAFWCGDIDAARRYTALLCEHSANLSFGYWGSWRRCYETALALVDAETADPAAALAALRGAALGPSYWDLLGTIHPALLDPTSVARAADGRNGWSAPEILRAHAVALLDQEAPGAAAPAEGLLLRAFALAEEQGARSWQLRIATSLACRYRDTGRSAAGRRLLAPVLDGFDQGGDTADLRRAGAVLRSL